MHRDIDLIRYLPLFVQEYREIRHITDAENPEFQLLASESETIKNNQFIITCDEVGIARFERILKIKPTPEDTLESRISRVLVRWNDVVPYTWKVFLQKMHTLCGDDFEIIKNWTEYQMKIITHLDVYGQVEEFEYILGYMMPSNLVIVAENILNYLIEGTAHVAAGQVFTSMFQLTDSFNVNWNLNGAACPVAAGSGTCEIMLTDSFNGMFAVDSEAGGFAAHSIANQIEVSDSFQGTI